MMRAADAAAREAGGGRELRWPAFEESAPPPGPSISAAVRPPAAPRPARPPRQRLEVPTRLDRWGE
jgi:hypothetical protein